MNLHSIPTGIRKNKPWDVDWEQSTYWVTGTLEIRPIREMTNNHLINTIRMIKTWMPIRKQTTLFRALIAEYNHREEGNPDPDMEATLQRIHTAENPLQDR